MKLFTCCIILSAYDILCSTFKWFRWLWSLILTLKLCNCENTKAHDECIYVTAMVSERSRFYLFSLPQEKMRATILYVHTNYETAVVTFVWDRVLWCVTKCGRICVCERAWTRTAECCSSAVRLVVVSSSTYCCSKHSDQYIVYLYDWILSRFSLSHRI